MFEHHLTKNLKEGEEVLRFVRRAPGSLWFSGLIALVVLLSPFFFLFPLLRLGAWGALGLVVLFFLGFYLLVRLLVLYSLNVLVITNLRLIDVDQRGFFHREVSESTYDKIQDVSFSMKGVTQTLFRIGNVRIQTAGAQANLEVRNVRNPELVQELIAKLQTEHQQQSGGPSELSADELLRLVKRLKEGMGEEQFRRLVGKS